MTENKVYRVTISGVLITPHDPLNGDLSEVISAMADIEMCAVELTPPEETRKYTCGHCGADGHSMKYCPTRAASVEVS